MEEELQEKRSYSRLWGDGRRRNVRSSGTFDPETLVQQKREWQRQNEAVREQLEAQSPATGLFEHFVIVGLSPSTDCSKFVAEPVPEVTPKTTTKHEYSGPSTETGVPEVRTELLQLATALLFDAGYLGVPSAPAAAFQVPARQAVAGAGAARLLLPAR
eukprot:scaffold921_cov397-Prasinococcus_capsulatus_cf.AAC.14